MAPEMRLLRLFTRSSKGVVASYTEPSFEPPRGRTLERQSRSSPGPHHKRLRITAPTVATVEEEDCATSTTSSQDQIACEVEGSDGGSSAEVALANIDPRLLQLEESASALGEQQKCVRFDNRAIVHRPDTIHIYEQVEEEGEEETRPVLLLEERSADDAEEDVQTIDVQHFLRGNDIATQSNLPQQSQYPPPPPPQLSAAETEALFSSLRNYRFSRIKGPMPAIGCLNELREMHVRHFARSADYSSVVEGASAWFAVARRAIKQQVENAGKVKQALAIEDPPSARSWGDLPDESADLPMTAWDGPDTNWWDEHPALESESPLVTEIEMESGSDLEQALLAAVNAAVETDLSSDAEDEALLALAGMQQEQDGAVPLFVRQDEVDAPSWEELTPESPGESPSSSEPWEDLYLSSRGPKKGSWLKNEWRPDDEAEM